MNERGIEDELVVVNALIQDDEAESLDKQFATTQTRLARGHIEICRLPQHVLAALRGMRQHIVKRLGAVTAGDDHRQPKFLAERFQAALAEGLEVVHRLLRRCVLDAVLHCRGALGELAEREVWRKIIVLHTRSFFSELLLLTISVRPLELCYPGCVFPLISGAKVQLNGC